MSSVLFLSESFTTTRLFEPVALALRELAPQLHVRLCDVGPACGITGEFLVQSDAFSTHGFDCVRMSEVQGQDREAYREQLRNIVSDGTRVIVVPHELPGWTADAITVAKEAGIATCHVQHGIFGPSFIGDEKPLQTKRQIEQLPDRGSSVSAESGVKESDFCRGADWKAVAGPYFARRLMEMGIPSSQIGVTGYVRTDAMFHSPVLSYDELCTRFSLNPDTKKLALYFWAPVDQYPGLYTQRYDQFDALRQVCAHLQEKWGDANILLLAHPKTDLAHLRQQAESHNLSNLRISRADGYHRSLYEHASLVVGVQSSCLVEAMLFRCPVLKLNFVLGDDRVPMLIEGGAVINVEHVRHLSDQLHRLCNDAKFLERTLANQQHVTQDLFYDFDGQCARRIAQGLVRLACKPSKDG